MSIGLIVMLVVAVVLALSLALSLYTLRRGAPWVPTKRKAVADLESILPPGVGKRAIDLGSGEGRLVSALAKAGYQADGVEINPVLVWWSQAYLRLTGRHRQTKVRIGSLWSTNLAPYDVIVLFGIPNIMAELRDKIAAECKPETIVLSNIFTFPEWPDDGGKGTVHRYRVASIPSRL